VAWNLVQQSETFDNAYWTSWGTNTITANNTTAPNGTMTADKFSGNGGGVFATGIGFSANQFFTLSFYAKKDTATSFGLNYVDQSGPFAGGGISYNFSTKVITITQSANSSVSAIATELQNGWVLVSMSFKVNSATSFNYIENSFIGGSGWCWGAQLNIGSTAKPYFPTTDRLNVPRLTYQNGGGGCPSLLLEKQSTNIVKYSQDISNTSGSYWGDGSSGGTATVTANYATSPDGTQNATRVQLNEGSLYAVWQQVLSTTSGTSYTYSIWLKAVSGTPTILWLYDGTANQNVTLTNDWVRYTFTFTGGTVAIARFGVWSGVWGTSTSADILAWGAQLEASSYPTSYIPTTSASATRVADACFKTGISSLIGQTEGTLFADINLNTDGSTFRVLLNLKGVNAADYITINTFQTTGNIYADINNTQVLIISGVNSGRCRIALAYKNNDVAFYINGALIGTSNFATIPATSEIGFNDPATSGVQRTSNVNQIALFKTRLTNAELASLTTI
jgi:hypothetical protein